MGRRGQESLLFFTILANMRNMNYMCGGGRGNGGTGGGRGRTGSLTVATAVVLLRSWLQLPHKSNRQMGRCRDGARCRFSDPSILVQQELGQELQESADTKQSTAAVLVNDFEISPLVPELGTI